MRVHDPLMVGLVTAVVVIAVVVATVVPIGAPCAWIRQSRCVTSEHYTASMDEAMKRKVTPPVLLADDQSDVREALRLLLKSEGLGSIGVEDPAAALEAARKRDFLVR